MLDIPNVKITTNGNIGNTEDNVETVDNDDKSCN